MARKQQDQELTFVFEVCANCKNHGWNTRHDETKYLKFFSDVAKTIKAEIPDTTCMMNKVPKAWYEKEIYCQLIPNNDAKLPNYDILPRLGAFEVSTVIDNTAILFFSKLKSQIWPSPSLVAKRVKACIDEWRKGAKVSQLQAKYQTQGKSSRLQRSPAKLRAVDPSRLMNNSFQSTSFTRTARSGFGDFRNLQMEVAEIESKPGTAVPGKRPESQASMAKNAEKEASPAQEAAQPEPAKEEVQPAEESKAPEGDDTA